MATLALAACMADPVPSRDAPSTRPPASEPQAPRATVDIAVIDGVSEAVAHELVDVALAYPRTSGVHEAQDYAVTEVSAVGDGTARVVIEFDDPLPPGTWPDEPVCAIGRDSNNITGIAWRISLDSMEISTYSPQWDYAIACA